jgi:hypothetical protein
MCTDAVRVASSRSQQAGSDAGETLADVLEFATFGAVFSEPAPGRLTLLRTNMLLSGIFPPSIPNSTHPEKTPGK